MHSRKSADRRGMTVVLAGYAAGAAWLALHPAGATATGSADPPTRLLIAFLLPTTAAVFLWLFSALEARRPPGVREPGDCAATERILLRFVAFAGALHILLVLSLSDVPWIWPWPPRLAFVLVGALLVSVGNLLPTTRPNVLVGIRTPRSLRSRHFWMEINRAGGYVAVGLGVIVIAAAVVLRQPLVGQVVCAAVLAAAGIVAARYRRLVRDSGGS